ncbi:hypothetical protein LUQ84_001522 [Hamiltosporidium tvaerminnensis]|nr:hypothetical protein LUQ84_001522 [Hamiltosporidium tvaerminnensis]
MREIILNATYTKNNIHCIIFFILYINRIIFAQKTIAIHFYENIEGSLLENKVNNNKNSNTSSYFSNINYISGKYNLKNKDFQVFIIELDTFLLKFLNEEEIIEGHQNSIYINKSSISYEDFLYFYNIVMCFPYLIDFMDECKYLKILRIINIFKFKYDKSFEEFIRLILVSLMINIKPTSKLNGLLKANIYSFPGYLSKRIIVQLFKLYLFSKKTLNKIKDISIAMALTKYYNLDFINLNEDYLYLDNYIIDEILEKYLKIDNFSKIIHIIFSIHHFRSIFMYKISYLSRFNTFFDLCLFNNLDEIFFFECFQTDFLIQKIYTLDIATNPKILTIIHCKFTIKDEISFLRNLKVKILNYDATKHELISIFMNLGVESLFQNFFSRFEIEIYNKENQSRILGRDTNLPCIDWHTEMNIIFYQELSIIEKLKIIEFPFNAFIYVELTNPLISFEFYTINLKDLKNITIIFTDTYIKDFNLLDTDLFSNIIHMRLVRSTITDIFLAKILLFPSLKSLFIHDCSIIFNDREITFSENTKIEKLYYRVSLIENKDYFLKYIFKMIALKNLEISCNLKDKNSLFSKLDCMNSSFINLTQLKYSVKHYFTDSLPKFSIFRNLSEFNFGFDYPEGTVYKIFHDQPFVNLKKIIFNGIKIGKNDYLALEKYTNLTHIYFSLSCKIKVISFSEIFDCKLKYSLQELRLPDIEFNYCDFLFFLKLKSLKKVYFYSFRVKIDIIYFLKAFSSVAEIDIEKFLEYKTLIHEEFGLRFSRLF